MLTSQASTCLSCRRSTISLHPQQSRTLVWLSSIVSQAQIDLHVLSSEQKQQLSAVIKDVSEGV